MQRDLRGTALYSQAETLCTAIRRPGTGSLSDAADISVTADGRQAVFAGAMMDRLEGSPLTRICHIDLTTGDTRVLTFGPNTDRLPKYSPDGTRVAFLSDRQKAGNYQLYLLDPVSGAATSTSPVDGWIEYLHWSPDGKRILLGVAGHGADISGGQGAVTSRRSSAERPSWMPTVETGDENFRWRKAWIYDVESGRVTAVAAKSNIWEAVWCGPEALAAVVSPEPGEGLWYDARLNLIDTRTGAERELYVPQDQLGWPAGSPSGKQLAVVEAVCSDRLIVAGDLRLIDTTSGRVERIDTCGVDVTHTEWRSNQTLLLAGHRGFETVIGLFDLRSRKFEEVWASRDISTGSRYVTVSGFATAGDCALLGEGYQRAPEIATIRAGKYRAIKSLDCGYSDVAAAIHSAEQITWKAPDGLEIQGYLLRPKSVNGTQGPHPLVMDIHGGPVFHWRPRWLGRLGIATLMLITKGYAVFLPNPRGSAGRGQEFARSVKGDINGADTHDYLSGLDRLVEQGLVDPRRIGVMGISYGGNMTSWLVTQDTRFAAAVAVSPHTNQVTERLISNIPRFVDLFVGDRYDNPTGKYFERSPVMHAHKARTPTLNIAGALDRCTPPEEAVQFHTALQENSVESALVIYPEEGHGIRTYPALIDYTARVVEWFDQHLK